MQRRRPRRCCTGQCAAIAARVGHEALRLRLLAAPGTWGAKAVADDDAARVAPRAYVDPGDTPEEAADRKARYKKLMDAAAKKTPWGKGKWAKPDAAADADKPAGKSKAAKRRAARKKAAAAKKVAAAGARTPGAKRVTLSGLGGAGGGRGGGGHRRRHQGATSTCHKCGRKGHFADQCPGT